MDRIALLLVALGAAAALLACEAAPVAKARPWNVVLVTLDTTRADALGAYGQELPTTPNMDALAERGVLFEQTLSAAPHTLTSHASILTGRLPPAHGVRSNQGYRLAASNETLAEALRAAGYATGAEIAATVMRGDTQIAQGFVSIGDTDTPGVEFQLERSGAGSPHAHDLVRTSSDISRNAVAFLQRHADEKFFLWLHYFDAHNPYQPPASLARRFPHDPYLAEVAATDAALGDVLDELDALGLRDRTLIVVTSDHGEGLGEHGEPTHSYFVYDTTMRVPLILSGPPALPAGRRVEAITRSIDIAPTILDLLGLPPLPQADGTSLRPWIQGKPPADALVAYGESVDLYSVLGTTPLRLLRDGRWKYIHKVGPELYDIVADPGERENLATARPEIVARMRAQLEALVAGLDRAPGGGELHVDAATAAGLEALGYVAPASGRALPPEATLLELSGTDPAVHAADLALISATMGAMSEARYASALQDLEALAARHPASAHIARMQGETLFGLERMDAAVAAFERAVELAPEDDANLRGLVRSLEASDRTEDALARLARFAERQPCNNVRGQLARRLHALGRYSEQAEVLAAGIAACPEAPGLLNDYAWLLATSPDASLRDGSGAVVMAERSIASLAGAAGANELDTLAAAHAEAGDYGAAVAAAHQAIALLETRGVSAESIEPYRARVRALEARTPIRD